MECAITEGIRREGQFAFPNQSQMEHQLVILKLTVLLAECIKTTRRVPELLHDIVLIRDLLAESTILLVEYSANFRIPELLWALSLQHLHTFWEELSLEMF